MGLETGTYIDDLNELWPLDTDDIDEVDDHLRLIKSVLTATFAGTGGDTYDEAITATLAEILSWDARISAMEASPGSQITPEVGYVNGSGSHTITGVGFQARAIMCVGLATNSSLYNMGLGLWHVDEGGHAVAMEANAAAYAAGNDFAGSVMALTNSTRTVDSNWEVDNVDEDGFDLSVINAGSSHIFWVAFP